jgi:hypothetical protein
MHHQTWVFTDLLLFNIYLLHFKPDKLKGSILYDWVELEINPFDIVCQSILYYINFRNALYFFDKMGIKSVNKSIFSFLYINYLICITNTI